MVTIGREGNYEGTGRVAKGEGTFLRKIKENGRAGGRAAILHGAEGNLVFIPPRDPYLVCLRVVCILSPFISRDTQGTSILYIFS